MTEDLISFETAKLAKEKGFGENPYLQLYTYYDLKGKLYNEEDCIGTTMGESSVYSWSDSVSRDSVKAYISGVDYSLDEYVLAPTQSLLQKWLREVHNLHIYIDTTSSFDGMETHRSKYKSHVKVPFTPFKWTTGHYYLGDTYEEALEIGLQEALKLIKKNKHEQFKK